MSRYADDEWNGAIASFGRLVDVRNFPDVAAEVLLGKKEAFLGRGVRFPVKALNPEKIGALVFWTKGPVQMFVEHPGLREVLETWNKNQAVIGLALSVTGLGGTFLEPGIPTVEQTAKGLEKVLHTRLIDPEAILLRYDPLVKILAPDGRILRNDMPKAFHKVISLVSGLGVKYVETKFLLREEVKGGKYHHVWKRLNEVGVTPLPHDNERDTFCGLKKLAEQHNMRMFTCCVKAEQYFPEWSYDQGCLSANRLTAVGKKLFGDGWNRLNTDKRASRKGCQCSGYFDLSNMKGHKKCGAQDAACLYCTASARTFGKQINELIKREIQEYCNGNRERYYEHLL